MRTYLVVIVTAAALTLAACGGHSAPARHSASATPAPVAATSAAPAGCQQATLVTAAVGGNLRQNPGATRQAMNQLKALGAGLPTGILKIDVDRAVVDIALFREYAVMGGPASAAAKWFAHDLRKIEDFCG
jgi:hypothetical protein